MNLQLPYDRAAALQFLADRFLPEDFKPIEENLESGGSKSLIQKLTCLGESRSLRLQVYEAEYGSDQDPRVALSRKIFRFLADYRVSQALVF